jgi:hypothetical protein
MEAPENIHTPHYINDNVHGRIGLTPLESDIIQTPTFLRLGRIQHLGLGSMVFPGATHTRLCHSLGTLHIMAEITVRLGLSAAEQEKLRLAALLHDIGQYPLSHVLELAYRQAGPAPVPPALLFQNPEVVESLTDSSLGLQCGAFAANPMEHAKDKQMAKHVIALRPDLQDVLRAHNKGQDFIAEVVAIITGAHECILFKQLMDSDYDCDRLDYVMRDARMTGVKYGFIDLQYLIENLMVQRDPPFSANRVLAVKKHRAVHALEHYLTARYYMYSQVTFHRIVRSLEIVARAVFRELMKRGRVYQNYLEIIRKIPSDEFLLFDDTYFWTNVFASHQDSTRDDPLRSRIDRLLQKRGLTLVREFRKVFDREKGASDQEYHNVKARLFDESSLQSLCNAAGVQRSLVVVEEVPVAFVPISSSFSAKEIFSDPENIRYAISISPRLYDEENQATEFMLDDRSSIMYELSKLELRIVRVFLECDDKQACEKFRGVLRQRLQ